MRKGPWVRMGTLTNKRSPTRGLYRPGSSGMRPLRERERGKGFYGYEGGITVGRYRHPDTTNVTVYHERPRVGSSPLFIIVQ